MGKLDAARGFFMRVSEGPEAKSAAHAAQALMGLGLLDWQEGRIDEARRKFEEVLTQARSLGEASLQAKAAGNLGVLFTIDGNIEAALVGFEEARAIHEELGDVDSTLVAYNNLGILHLQRGASEEAVDCYARVQRLARGLGNDRWLSLALCGLSDAWRQKSDAGQALDYARKAHAVAERFDPGLELGVAERVLGDSLLAGGFPKEAYDCFARAMPLLESSRDDEDLKLARKGHLEARQALGFPG